MKAHASVLLALTLALSACMPAAEPAPPDDPVAPTLAQGSLPGPQTEVGQLARQCQKPVYCGDVGYVDCGAAVDRPAYYFDRDSGEVLGRCGGYCMMQGEQCAASCPPPRWQCGAP